MGTNPLIETEIEALAYLAFGKPRTQKKAVELIYGKSYDEVNIQPFVDAKESLLDKGFIQKCDEKERNARYEADHDQDIKDLLDNYGFLKRRQDKISLDNAEILTFVVTKMI